MKSLRFTVYLFLCLSETLMLPAYDFEYHAGNINGSYGQNGYSYTLNITKSNLGTTYDFDTRSGVTSGNPSTMSISVSSGCATGTVHYAEDTPPTANFTMSMHGLLIPPPSGGGETEVRQPSWYGDGNAIVPYRIKSNQNNGAKEIVVPAGTSVTYTAYEGTSPKASNWTVNGETKNNESSIIFNRSWWDVPGWFSASMGTPNPGTYDITAKPTDNAEVSDSGKMIVVGANFTNGNCPGYDDYTNWNKDAIDYYSSSSSRTGRCTLPYFAVQDQGRYNINLNLIPTATISKDVCLEENDISISYLTPEITRTNTRVGFVASSLLFSSEGDITAKLDGTTIATSTVCIYKKKDIKVLFVRVNNQSGAPDYSAFEQAIFSINVDFQTYTKSSVTVKGVTYAINASTIWTRQMLEKLRDDFYSENPNIKNEYNYVQFQVVGSVIRSSVLGMADGIPSRDSWISQNVYLRTYPHELGHCLGLSHRNKYDSPCEHSQCDRDALMCQTSHAKSRRNLESTKLRKGEWDALH